MIPGFQGVPDEGKRMPPVVVGYRVSGHELSCSAVLHREAVSKPGALHCVLDRLTGSAEDAV